MKKISYLSHIAPKKKALISRPLTPNELKCIYYASFGKEVKEIAILLKKTESSIIKIRASACHKLRCERINEAIFFVTQRGYLPLKDKHLPLPAIEVDETENASIDPLLLTHANIHANIDVQLDTLEKKVSDLFNRGHQHAATEVKSLVFELRQLNRWYFSEGKIEYLYYKTRALQAIDETRPILEQHRGYKKILGNLILLILTISTAFLIHKTCTGHFLFFKQTESAKQLDALTQTFNTLSLPQKS